MRGGGGSKMSVFVHAQGKVEKHLKGSLDLMLSPSVKGGVKQWQNSVHVVVE